MSHATVTLKPYSDPERPKLKYQVFWPASEPGKPRRRKRFEHKSAATAFRDLKAVEVLNAGREGGAVHHRAVKEAAWAIGKLDPHGLTIREVVEDFLSRFEARKKSAGIPDAVEEFLVAKEKDGASERYLRDLQNRLRTFAKAKEFKKLAMSDASTPEIAAWLRRLKFSPTTRNNYRRILTVFFSWGESMGYCESNPAKRSPMAKEADKPVKIFTPGELRVILEHAPGELVPFLAIQAFAGLRTAEVARLDWKEIDFLRGHIEVTGAKSKTAQRRFVPLNDTLRQWLEPHAKTSGSIAPLDPIAKLRRFHRHLEDLEAATAENRPTVTWKSNGLRHSFASYAISAEEDAGRVALWLGHANPQMTFGHYRERATQEEAQAWFGVTPNAEAQESRVVGL